MTAINNERDQKRGDERDHDRHRERPSPSHGPDTRPYWDGLAAERLMLQRCGRCGRIRHYPRPVCTACHSTDVTWTQASGRGTVHSWSITHQAFDPRWRDRTPYTLVTVELDEGVRMQAPLRGAGPECLRLALPVRIVYERQADGSVLPAFRPDDEPSGTGR